MKQWRNRDAIHTVLAEIVGSLLVAVGIHNFAVYAEFPLTGFSGIALIVYRLTGLSIGGPVRLAQTLTVTLADAPC